MKQYIFTLAKKQKHVYLIIASISITIVVIGIIYTIQNYQFQLPQNNKVISKVGEELLYANDFNYEMQNTEIPHKIEKEKYILDKLATDSMILQEAQKKRTNKSNKSRI